MSRVYFHSPSGEAELNGSERAHFGCLVRDAAVRVLDLSDAAHIRRLRELVARDHYLAPMEDAMFARSFETCMRVSSPVLSFADQPIGMFTLVLNTALLDADDQMRLAARIEGQCEIHAYIEGPNRAWVADMIDRGLETGLYRKGMYVDNRADGSHGPWRSQGWENVLTLLRSRDDEPVVMSYSVCDSFPNPDAMEDQPPMPDGWRPDHWSEQEWAELDDDYRGECWDAHLSDRWYEQPAEVQWDRAMAALRTSGMGLELKPDDWDTFRFTHELTVLDLYADDWRDRLANALGGEP